MLGTLSRTAVAHDHMRYTELAVGRGASTRRPGESYHINHSGCGLRDQAFSRCVSVLIDGS